MSRLLELLPPYEKNSRVFQEIMSVEQIEFDKLNIDIADLEKQLNIDTATWGLEIYEKELGLPVNQDLSINTRRKLIKSKLLMQPPASKSKIVDIIKSFVETAEVKEYFSEYKFEVVLKTLDTIGDKLHYIKQIVDDFKPAHLDYAFTVCYLFYPKISYMFGKWLSEEIKVCGTEDINENKYIATIGLSYKDKILYMFGKWLSNFIRASEQTTIQCEGKIFKYKTMCDIGVFESVRIPACSENIYVKEVVA